MKLSIIIPAYNEEGTIEQMLDALCAVDFGSIKKEIIVVDDGSTDATIALLKKSSHPITLIEHKRNRGKSGAIRTGLAAASGEYVVIQDADLEYDSRDIAALLKYAVEHDLPAVYGSRRLRTKSNLHIEKRTIFYYGGISLSLLTNILYGSQITDEPTCYKLIRRDILQTLKLKEERFSFCPEVTAKLLRSGHTIAELPITYTPRSLEDGKKIAFKDAFEATLVLLKYRVIPKRFW